MKMRGRFERINKLIAEYNFHPTVKIATETYEPILKASFVKCFEFNLHLQRSRNLANSFFLSPFLRGLCEDLIALKYIGKYFAADRDAISSAYMRYYLFSSMSVQHDFFDSRGIIQRHNYTENIDKMIAQEVTTLKSFMVKYGRNKDRIFPSVEHMAIDTGLKELYNFLYFATSKMVHFSPHILLRMGWYKDDGPTVFSIKNFHRYYAQFNEFYGAYLFVLYCEAFKKPLQLEKNFLAEVKEMKKAFEGNAFHPELVTFEELNIKRPGRLMDFILKSLMYESKRGKDSKEHP
jgi:hypothetical protein